MLEVEGSEDLVFGLEVFVLRMVSVFSPLS